MALFWHHPLLKPSGPCNAGSAHINVGSRLRATGLILLAESALIFDNLSCFAGVSEGTAEAGVRKRNPERRRRICCWRQSVLALARGERKGAAQYVCLKPGSARTATRYGKGKITFRQCLCGLLRCYGFSRSYGICVYLA